MTTPPKLGQPKPHVCSKCGRGDVLATLPKGHYFKCNRCEGDMIPQDKPITFDDTPPRPKPTPADSCFEFKGIKKNTKQQSFNW